MNINGKAYQFEKTALLVIDQQVQFCAIENGYGNKQTEDVAARIAEIKPTLSNMVSKTYFIYSDFSNTLDDQIDFYKIKPQENQNQIVMRKKRNSAFLDYAPHPYIKDRSVGTEGKFAGQLRDMGIKNLLICGFNLHACVAETAIDACQRGFHVTVLGDLVENNTPNRQEIHTHDAHSRIRKMHDHGIVFIQSKKLSL